MISLLPFTESYDMLGKSKKILAGEWSLRTILNNKEAMRKHTIAVSESINHWWPRLDLGKVIIIQMDNSTLHLSKDNPAWIEAKKDFACNICLVKQLLQSLEINILDLGLWTSLQSVQRKLLMMSESSSKYKLIKIVQRAWINLLIMT